VSACGIVLTVASRELSVAACRQPRSLALPPESLALSPVLNLPRRGRASVDDCEAENSAAFAECVGDGIRATEMSFPSFSAPCT